MIKNHFVNLSIIAVFLNMLCISGCGSDDYSDDFESYEPTYDESYGYRKIKVVGGYAYVMNKTVLESGDVKFEFLIFDVSKKPRIFLSKYIAKKFSGFYLDELNFNIINNNIYVYRIYSGFGHPYPSYSLIDVIGENGVSKLNTSSNQILDYDFKGTLSMYQNINGIDKSGKYLYKAENEELSIIDISNIKNPVLVNKYKKNGYNFTMHSFIIGFKEDPNKFFFLPLEKDSCDTPIGIVDVSDPEQVKIRGSFYLGNKYSDEYTPCFSDKTIVYSNSSYVLIDGAGSFKIIDIRNPDVPYEIGRYIYPEKYSLSSVIVASDRYVFYKTGENVVVLVDISVPEKPKLVREYDYSGVEDISISENDAYILTRNKIIAINLDKNN